MNLSFKKAAPAVAADPAIVGARDAIIDARRGARTTERAKHGNAKQATDVLAIETKTADARAAEAQAADARAVAAEAAAMADRQARGQAAAEQLAAAQHGVDVAAETGGDVAAASQALVAARAAAADPGETALQIQAAALRRNAERLRQAADAAEAVRAQAQRASARAWFELHRHRMDVAQFEALLAYVAAKAAWRRWAAVDASAPALEQPIFRLRSVRPLSGLWADVPDAAMPPEVERRLLELFADPTVELPSAT